MVTSEVDHFNGKYDAQVILVIICSTLSMYNALELVVLIFTTFQEWHGLYFYSLTVATLGVFPYCLGFITRYFTNAPPAIGMTIGTFGWVMLITGQSVVLYSRLHLMLDDVRVLRGVKWMIVIDAVILHSLTTIVFFGSVYTNIEAFKNAYHIVEKIQMTIFTVQEFIISGLYVWKTVQLLQIVSKERIRRVAGELLLINILVIIMDIGLLVVEYRNLYVLEQVIKSFIYSVKLKLEFAILSKLVDLVKSSQKRLSATLTNTDTWVSLSHQQSNISTAGHGRRTSLKSAPQWIQDLENVKVVEHRELAEPKLTSKPRRTSSDHEGRIRINQMMDQNLNIDPVSNESNEYADFMKSLSNS